MFIKSSRTLTTGPKSYKTNSSMLYWVNGSYYKNLEVKKKQKKNNCTKNVIYKSHNINHVPNMTAVEYQNKTLGRALDPCANGAW